MKKDVITHKTMFKESEDTRHELQIHIEKTSITIQHDTEEHSQYQTKLITENDQLKNEIQHLNEVQARKDQEYLRKTDKASKEHSNQILQLETNYN